MSAWAYCDFCDSSFDKPTTQDIVDQIRICHRCGRANEVRCTTVNELIVSMEQRITELEAKIFDLAGVKP